MKHPKMILFDYGHTLVYEPHFHFEEACAYILKMAIQNPKQITADELNLRKKAEIVKLTDILRKHNLEINHQALDRLLHSSLGLISNISYDELEYEYWLKAEPIIPMEGIQRLLELLHYQHIRTGVISNLCYSGNNLKKRLNRVLPENHFEFVLTSCDYLYRKPEQYMFQTAIQLSGLQPDEIWYCGDSIQFDVEASSQAGMYPVWYESELACIYREKENRIPDCDYVHIKHWNELTELLVD